MPFQRVGEGGRGSNFTNVSYNTGICAAQMGGFYTQKILKHGSQFNPTKDPETWVKFVENLVKNDGENFGKLVGLHSLRKS